MSFRPLAPSIGNGNMSIPQMFQDPQFLQMIMPILSQIFSGGSFGGFGGNPFSNAMPTGFNGFGQGGFNGGPPSFNPGGFGGSWGGMQQRWMGPGTNPYSQQPANPANTESSQWYGIPNPQGVQPFWNRQPDPYSSPVGAGGRPYRRDSPNFGVH